MGVTWSRRAIRQQRDFNDVTESLEQRVVQLEGLTHQLLPTLARARELVPPGSSGQFEFLSGLIGGALVPSGEESLMYNLVGAGAIAIGDDVIASRVMLPDSGEAGWVVFRDTRGASARSFACPTCSEGQMGLVGLRINGLKDLDDDPTFDGWDEVVNGDHDLQHSPPFLPCAPGITFTTPDNSETTGAITFPVNQLGIRFGGPLGFPVLQSSLRLFEVAMSLFVLGRPFGVTSEAGVTFEEQSSGVGFMTRTDGKIDCDQTYSNYAETSRNGDKSLQLSNWLANGTFEINPP